MPCEGKEDGSTSYFYQDIALATKLNDTTLYLTGYEQENHFKTLKKIFPKTNHIGLGLVKYKSSKMSSRFGNVIYMVDILKEISDEFEGNEKLAYNIFAGYILKSDPTSDKVFNLDSIRNPKNSLGLYLSYTMARLKSAKVVAKETEHFDSQELEYSYFKTKHKLNPMYLFNSLIELSKEMNSLYLTHNIIGNKENTLMFSIMLGDLTLGMKKLGLFEIDKV